MTAGYRISRMRWWHLDRVMELEHELFEAETWSLAGYWNELAEAGRRYVVAVDPDDLVLGFGGLAVGGDEAHVLTLAVTGAAQGGGLGTALLRDLLDAAGDRRVFLEVRADNPTAQRLYERHGFVPVGRRRRYYQPSGVDAVVMARG